MSAPEATEALQHNGVVTQATRKRRLVHGSSDWGKGPHHDGSGPDNEATMYGDPHKPKYSHYPGMQKLPDDAEPANAEATVADQDPTPPWKAEFEVVFKQAMSSLKQEIDALPGIDP